MANSFFDDWDPCDICGKDHQYDYEEAIAIHRQIALDKFKDKLMEQNQVSYKLPMDPVAFYYAVATFALVVSAIVGVWVSL